MRNRPPSLRWLWITLVVLFLVGVLGVIGISAWVNSYLRSEAFRSLVAAKTGDALRADAKYDPFRWTGATVFTENLDLIGRENSPLKNLNARQIRAEVNWRAIFSGAWRIEDITVVKADAVFGPPTLKSAAEQTPMPTKDLGFLPQRFEVGRLTIDDATLALGEGTAQAGLLKGTTLEMKPDGSGWVISGSGGEFLRAGLPPCKTKSFRARMQKEAFFLTDARLTTGESGKIAISGESKPTESHFDLEYDQVDVAPLLTPEWNKRLSGQVTGTTSLSMQQGKPATASGKMTLKDGRLENIPILDQIAKFTGAPQFKRMSLQEVTGSYTWDGRNLLITNFVTESKGLMRIEGDCQITQGGGVQGIFRVGVTSQTLQWLPGSQDHVFTESRNGYLWTDMKVGGTLNNLTEDLTQRLAAAMSQKVIEEGVNILNSTPGATKENIKGALDILAPLLAP